MLRLTALALITLFEVRAASITSSYYLGVSAVNGPTPQTLVFTGPSVVNESLTADVRYTPFLGLPNLYADLTADAIANGSASADEMHAYVQSAASVTWSPSDYDGGLVGPNAFSNLGFTSTDAFHFSSASLPSGTPVTFQLTVTLHSVLDATSVGTCSGSPAGRAEMAMAYNGGGLIFAPLIHDTCGVGAESMTFSGIFGGVIGTPFGVKTTIAVNSSAGKALQSSGEVHTTVDAGATGNVYVTVLTPGVDFTSDSGALYTSVPEPASGLLMLACFGLAALSERRASDYRQ